MSKKNHRKLVKKISRTSNFITQRFGTKVSRSLHITGATGAANLLIATGKLLIGIFSFSFFTCVNSFYSFGMILAKYCALTGIIKTKNKKEQYHYYILSGSILIAASVMYIIYSIRLFLYPSEDSYHSYIAILIAAITFTELGLNIRGAIIERHNHTPLIHAIKIINLASSLICLVLTQTAILSFASANKNIRTRSTANGFIGILMGMVATILGIYMIIRVKQIQKGKNYRTDYRKIKKVIKKEGMRLKIKPIRYIETESEEQKILSIKLKTNEIENSLEDLQKIIKQELGLILLNIEEK